MEWYGIVILILASFAILLLIIVVKLVFFIEDLKLDIQKIQIDLTNSRKSNSC